MQTLYSKQYGPLASKETPIVFLHGFLGNSNDWDHVIDTMPTHIPMICIDLPGHGLSTDIFVNPKDGFTHTCQLIKNTLDKLNIHPCVLLGYSLGGRVALHFAKLFSGSVKALIIESANFGLPSPDEQEQRHSADQRWAEKFQTLPIKESLTLWYEQGVFCSLSEAQKLFLINSKLGLKLEQGSEQKSGLESESKSKSKSKSKIDCAAIAHMLLATSLAKQNNLNKKLPVDGLPLYYLFGELDKKFKTLAVHYNQRHNQLKAIEFCDAGHNIHFEQPLNYAQEITNIYSSINK